MDGWRKGDQDGYKQGVMEGGCRQAVSYGENRVTEGIQEVRFREKGGLGGMQGGRHGDKRVPGRV